MLASLRSWRAPFFFFPSQAARKFESFEAARLLTHPVADLPLAFTASSPKQKSRQLAGQGRHATLLNRYWGGTLHRVMTKKMASNGNVCWRFSYLNRLSLHCFLVTSTTCWGQYFYNKSPEVLKLLNVILSSVFPGRIVQSHLSRANNAAGTL